MLVRACAADKGPIPLNHPCLVGVPDGNSTWLRLCIAGWIAFLLAVCFLVILVRERWEQKASLQACLEAGERKVQAQKAAACRRAWRRKQAAEKISEHQGREENMTTALGCGKTFVFDPAAEASNFGAEVAGACAETMHRRMDLMPERWMDPAQNFWQLAGLGVA